MRRIATTVAAVIFVLVAVGLIGVIAFAMIVGPFHGVWEPLIGGSIGIAWVAVIFGFLAWVDDHA